MPIAWSAIVCRFRHVRMFTVTASSWIGFIALSGCRDLRLCVEYPAELKIVAVGVDVVESQDLTF